MLSAMSDVPPGDRVIETPRTHLVLMPVDFMQASLDRDREQAAKILGVHVPQEWPDDDDLFMLRIRLEDIAEHPDWAPWLVRAIVDRSQPRMLGYINFHRAPDSNGLVEVGYTIFSEHRRRGYAEEASRALFGWALGKGAKRLRASISPDNDPSLRMIQKLGFQWVGQQWDELDGLELVFERRLEPGEKI
jgi:[ribosomal protein S5]-alanine N-acetyltransferase